MASSGMPSNGILKAHVHHPSAFPFKETTGDRHRTMPTMANTWNNGKNSSATPVQPAPPPFQLNYGGMLSIGIMQAPAPHLSAFSKTATTGDRNWIMPTVANTSAYSMNSSATPAYRVQAPSQPSYGGMPSNGIRKARAPHLPAISIAATTGDRHQPTVLAMANTWANGMNSSASSSASAAPADRAPPPFQPDYRRMPPYGILKARAPHLWCRWHSKPPSRNRARNTEALSRKTNCPVVPR